GGGGGSSSGSPTPMPPPTPMVASFAGNVDGYGSLDGTGAVARFNMPAGVAADSAGNVYVADQVNSTIRKVTPAGAVTTIAGTAGFAGGADGTGTAATFNNPSAVATDSTGNVFVADTSGNRIRKITSAAVVTTFANGFIQPNGVATDGA